MKSRVRKGERPEEFMERVRAGACFANTSNSGATQLSVFMALFHPNHPEDSTRQIVSDVRQRESNR